MARFIQRRCSTSFANSTDGNDIVKIAVHFIIDIDGLPKDILVKNLIKN